VPALQEAAVPPVWVETCGTQRGRRQAPAERGGGGAAVGSRQECRSYGGGGGSGEGADVVFGTGEAGEGPVFAEDGEEFE